MATKKINIKQLGAEISQALTDYTEEVSKAIEKEVDKTGKQLAKDVREASPENTGDYAKGWTSKKTGKKGMASRTIYNKNKPWLVHLLEMGHLKRGGKGRVEGTPHLRPAYRKASQEFIKKVEEIIKNGG